MKHTTVLSLSLSLLLLASASCFAAAAHKRDESREDLQVARLVGYINKRCTNQPPAIKSVVVRINKLGRTRNVEVTSADAKGNVAQLTHDLRKLKLGAAVPAKEKRIRLTFVQSAQNTR